MSVFYGWKISGLSLAGNFLLQGAAVYCMNAFMEPLCDLHGWSRLELNTSMGFSALMGQIAMPFAAAIAAKYSLRLLMAAGALIGGLATCAMGFTSSIYLFTIFFVTVFVTAQFCGGVVGNALMSNWFRHYRGIALGIANSGVSLSGVILPFICLIIIQHFNTATAYVVLGLATCSLAPLSWWIVRKNPQMLNLHPDGRKHEPRPIKKLSSAATTLKELVRNPATWYIGIICGTALMCGAGILSQLKPRFSDHGITPYTAMLLASISSIFGTLAKYFWGWVCDKTNSIFATRALMITTFCSLLMVHLPANVWTLCFFAICFATAVGGAWVVLPAVTAYYFGSANFLNAYKVISIFILIRCLGFPIMGFSYELTHNYLLADLTFTALAFLAIILSFFLRKENAAENITRKR